MRVSQLCVRSQKYNHTDSPSVNLHSKFPQEKVEHRALMSRAKCEIENNKRDFSDRCGLWRRSCKGAPDNSRLKCCRLLLEKSAARFQTKKWHHFERNGTEVCSAYDASIPLQNEQNSSPKRTGRGPWAELSFTFASAIVTWVFNASFNQKHVMAKEGDAACFENASFS